MAVVILLSVGACQQQPRPSVPPTSASAVREREAATKWLISEEALHLLADAGMSRDELSATFNVPDTYLISGGGSGPDYPDAVRTQSFTSVTALESAIDHHLDAETRAVLYDDEAWSLTPTVEQQDPAAAEARAAAVAHAHNLVLIATPATDLTRIPAPGEPSYAAFLRLGLVSAAAKWADVIDIQAQGSEADTAKYADFVKQAAAAARAANPHIVVLAGISTNPSGQSVTVDQLGAVIDATRALVDGYWLNIPQAGKACPRCGIAQPEIAVALLRKLGRR
ncbi:hypothetical protein ACFXPS_42870 [Nocardia sp. NPDC059091]|uniref:hypothetical protein n=1 Tax=unclassified Nocardia TaxID=2637762 RepID=UPI0036B37F45